MKVSVSVTTFRPGYIDSIAASLAAQTMDPKEWELILVDDFYQQRGRVVEEYLRARIKNFTYLPPWEAKDYSAPATSRARNTVLMHSRGELIYCICDYSYPNPRCLERHWEIYTKYGPNIIISGPLVDAIVASGQSVWLGAPARPTEIREKGETTSYLNWTPGIDVPLKDNFDQMTEENFISVFKEPFNPPAIHGLNADWRLGAICGKFIDDNLYENTHIHPWSWWWAGRNDSASLETLLDVNGMDESFDGTRGGADGDIAHRMMDLGCRYLVDTKAPCYELIHPLKKPNAISEEERDRKLKQAMVAKVIPNDYSIREERRRILKK